jgi:hypothetical protein
LSAELADLRNEPHPKGFYFGAESPFVVDRTPDDFVRKSALYYNKLILLDPFYPLRDGLTPDAAKRDLMRKLWIFWILRPWVSAGLIELLPYPHTVADLEQLVSRFADTDESDANWQALALGMDRGSMKRIVDEGCSDFEPSYLEGHGGANKLAIKTIVRGTSIVAGYAFFGSLLTSSCPITDIRPEWEIFGQWVLKRAKENLFEQLGRNRSEEFIRSLKTGRAWFALNARELADLGRLSPEKILEIRNSTEYSFQNFRKDLGHAIDEIEGLKLGDEKSYREAVHHAWEKVRDSAKDVRRDSGRIRKWALVEGVTITSLVSFTFGLLSFSNLALGPALAIVPAAGTLAKQILEWKELKKSSGYFLLELENAEQPVTV